MKIHKVMQNGKFLGLPEVMGVAKSNQLCGTDMEKFSEACGRVCYDSLGQGRSSEGFHAHIREVGHLNVYEGCVLRIKATEGDGESNFMQYVLGSLAPRAGAGLWILEANRRYVDFIVNASFALKTKLFQIQFKQFMPNVFGHSDDYTPMDLKILSVEPADYTSYWVQCSRCMSHELVRHRWQAHVSQRSTRYVDESESPIHWHPEYSRNYGARVGIAIPHKINDKNEHIFNEDGTLIRMNVHDINMFSQKMYDAIVSHLTIKGVPRKQARGAARFVLPMGLETQMIFGASREEWTNIVYQRANEHADAEIAEFGYAVKSDLKITDQELAAVAARLEHLQ